MSKKYYAVRKGHKPGIYEDWEEAEENIKGYSNAEYKGFKKRDDAEKFINEETEEKDDMGNEQIDELIKSLKDNEAILFTDGTFNEKKKRYGYGVVLIANNIRDSFFKSDNKKEYLVSRNIAGELSGIIDGIKACEDKGFEKIYLFYDLKGVEEWASGDWKRDTVITQTFYSFMQDINLEIEYYNIRGHDGIKYNEEADILAAKSTDYRGFRTYDSGNVYIEHFKKVDLLQIIEDLKRLYQENAEILSVEEKQYDGKELYSIQSGKSKITVWFYQTRFSLYIQGNYNTLFNRFLNILISDYTSHDKLLHTLNQVYFTNLSDDEIVRNLHDLLPNFESTSAKEKYHILLEQAVYNYLLTSVMPDYSHLPVPIFRCVEKILHFIFNEKLGKSTTMNNGRNNFSYFDKDSTTGLYYCNVRDIENKINDDQKVLLNDLYNYMQDERNELVHFSELDIDTVTIDRIDVAKDILERGFKLINRYYEVY